MFISCLPLSLSYANTDLVSAFLVSGQFLLEGINVSGFLLQDWLQNRQVHFHFVHKLIGLQQFGQNVLHTIPGLYINTPPTQGYMMHILPAGILYKNLRQCT